MKTSEQIRADAMRLAESSVSGLHFFPEVHRDTAATKTKLAELVCHRTGLIELLTVAEAWRRYSEAIQADDVPSGEQYAAMDKAYDDGVAALAALDARMGGNDG